MTIIRPLSNFNEHMLTKKSCAKVAIERELPPKIRKLSIAPLLAESVARAIHSESISSMMTVKAHKSEK